MGAEIMLETGIATLVAVLGGAIAAAAAGEEPAANRRRLLALVSVAAGALLAVTLFSLFPEARENLSLFGLGIAAASGYALYYLIGRYVFPVCPACASGSQMTDQNSAHIHGEPCSHNLGTADGGHRAETETSPGKHRTNFRNIATLLGVVVAAHAAVDGIAIASGHHNHASGEAISTSLVQALPLLFALSLHKLPEGLALTALLISSGFRRSRAFLLTVGIEMATLLGGALGVMLRDVASPALLSGIMAHVGGGFLYLAFQALRGETGEHPPAQTTAVGHRFGYGGLGFVCVALMLWAIYRLPNAQ